MNISKTLLIALCMGSISVPTAAMQESMKNIPVMAGVIIFSACGGTSLIASALNVWALEEKKEALLVEMAKTKSAKAEVSGFSRRRRAARHRLILESQEKQNKELKDIEDNLRFYGRYGRNSFAGGCFGLAFAALGMVDQVRSEMIGRRS